MIGCPREAAVMWLATFFIRSSFEAGAKLSSATVSVREEERKKRRVKADDIGMFGVLSWRLARDGVG